jgi:hypothetical protein
MPKPPWWANWKKGASNLTHSITDPVVDFTNWVGDKAEPLMPYAEAAGGILKGAGRQVREAPVKSWATDYVPGLLFGGAQGITRLAGAIAPGLDTTEAAEAIGERIPKTPLGAIGGMIGSMAPEFNAAADIGSIGYTKDAYDDYKEGEGGVGNVALEAIGMLPFLPSMGRAGRDAFRGLGLKVAGPALLDEAGNIIHSLDTGAATHAEVYNDAISHGILSEDAWLTETQKGFIDTEGGWLSRAETYDVAGDQFTGKKLSDEELQTLKDKDIAQVRSRRTWTSAGSRPTSPTWRTSSRPRTGTNSSTLTPRSLRPSMTQPMPGLGGLTSTPPWMR